MVLMVPWYPIDVKWCYLTHNGAFRNVRRMASNRPKAARKQTGARLNEDLVVEVRVLAIRERRGFNELMEEAMEDLLKKYREKKKSS